MFAQPRVKQNALQPPSKKRKTVHNTEEITFDGDARAEYLSGFRKRKQARIKQAQEVAARKDRQARLEMRKQIREERKQAVEEQVQAVRRILEEARDAGTGTLSQESSEDEWGGLSDNGVMEAPIDLEEEYIDEDRYTTVTVEAVRVDRDGLHKPVPEPDRDSEDDAIETEVLHRDGLKGPSKTRAAKERPKKKKKSFRYESKFDRKLTERKQRAKRNRR